MVRKMKQHKYLLLKQYRMQSQIQSRSHHHPRIVPARHQHINHIHQFLMQNMLELIGCGQRSSIPSMAIEGAKVNVRQIRMSGCRMTQTVSLKRSLIFVPFGFAGINAFRVASVPWHDGDVSGNDDGSDIVIGRGFEFVGCEELEEGRTSVGEFVW